MNKIARFVIVDDDPIIKFLCEQLLRQLKPETAVVVFLEPEKALTFIKNEYSQRPQNQSTILFLDINMPSMTGWEFLDVFKGMSEKIKEQFRIYILSSSVDPRDKEKANSNGFVSGFISKPPRLETFRKIILAHDDE